MPVLALAERLGLIDSSTTPATELLRAATHPEEGLSLRLRQLSRVAFNLRDRMSADNWRTLNRLIADPVFQRGSSLPLALGWLDRAVTSMMTLSGYRARRHDARHRLALPVDRAAHRAAVQPVHAPCRWPRHEGRAGGLDWLLELADSTVTYRSRYLVAPEWLPVLDLLVRDDTNPRSVAFQVKGLVEYVDKLERAPRPLCRRRAGAGARRAAVARADRPAPRERGAGRSCWSSCTRRRARCRTS